MRRIMICGLVLLIGICCATGCGGAGAGTGEALSPQAGREGAGEAGAMVADAGDMERGEAGGIGADAGGTGSTGTEAGGTECREAGGIGPEAGAADGETGPGKEEMAYPGTLPEPGAKEPGALSVEGTQLVDEEGNPVQLKGISTHGLAWYPQYVNEACFRQLGEEWGMDVVRLAMYTAEGGGYCTDGNQDALKALVREGVEYATDCGLYVIIDWHILSDGNPNAHLEEAEAFFREMSAEYADYDNVIYEICNEPNGGVSWAEIKSYAEQVIAVIREQDGDGIILVGTPNWSQYVEQAVADPITGYDNIMYTLHFYASTHKDSLRGAMVQAIAAGLPIFVSEYGICDASGNGGIDAAQADEWVRAMDEYGISYVAWNLSNKAETSAILKSSCSRTSGFSEEDLSDSGKWLLEMLGSAGDGKAGIAGTAQADGPAPDRAGTDRPQGTDKPQDTGTGKEDGQACREEPGDGTAGEAVPGTDNLTVKADVVNSWEQNNETYYQYEVEITNPGEAAREDWKITLTFGGDIALQDSWNGNCQAEGNVLTITQMDYNGHLEAGGSVGGIGFILKIVP